MAFIWEAINEEGLAVYRAAVPGGWLVALGVGGMTFVSDPNHEWDGNTLPVTVP